MSIRRFLSRLFTACVGRLYPVGSPHRKPLPCKSAVLRGDESEKRLESWSFIGQSDVVRVCHEICESILELERVFETGELSSRLRSGCFEKVLGSHIFEAYLKLAYTTPGRMHHMRCDAVRSLLAQFKNDLTPTQIAYAKVIIPGDSASCVDKSGEISRTESLFKFVDASFDGGPTTTLRLKQMLDARFWRIGFKFDTLDLCDAFTRKIVRTATQQLATELLGLQRILKRFSPIMENRKVRVVPDPVNRRFEHLILDILNEHEHHARTAPLIEDFFEKTDIRVNYPGLERKRGGRVQVTLTIAPEFHKAKIQAIKKIDEFVFLSPLSMAEFVHYLHGRTPGGSASCPSSFSLASLWDCFDTKPYSIPQLAYELKRIMVYALNETPGSPLGPMVEVPQPIRELIRLFVETNTFASTKNLREREKHTGRTKYAFLR